MIGRPLHPVWTSTASSWMSDSSTMPCLANEQPRLRRAMKTVPRAFEQGLHSDQLSTLKSMEESP